VLFTALAIGAFQVLAIVGAGTASAVTQCAYNPATDTINITIDPNDTAYVAVETAADDLDATAPPGSILFWTGAWSACGSASNSNTVSIVVLGTPGADETFVIDEYDSTGQFNTAIAWAIDLGTNTASGDWFEWWGSDNLDFDDNVVVTSAGFDLNGAQGELNGSAENMYLYGGDGDDVLDGSALPSSIYFEGYGADGDDWLAPGAFNGDYVEGNADTDTVSFGTRTTCTVADNAGGVAGQDVNCDGDLADVGDEVDTLGDDFEVLETGSGNDTLIGSGTAETFVPGDGDDDITGQAGDTIDWSSSSAGMVIDPANGTATGQGTDTFDGPDGFVGSPSDDTLLWDGSTVFFSGGDGTDKVDASATTGGESIDLDALDGLPLDGLGAPADDLENVIGGSGNDDLFGNDQRNRIEGGEGDDDLEGDDGNDVLIGAAGNDDISGGEGADKVVFKNSPAAVDVDLSLGFATGDGDDSLGGDLEIVVGSGFNDTITGGGASVAANFRFVGGNGKDVLTGSDGNDTLKGGGGKDTVRGGVGDDTLIGGNQNDLLAGGGGFDIGKGGNGKDVCKGVERRFSCGKQGHPARTFHTVAAKLARLG
jgi:Ca2+-binding RTX toxin-like protein